jgi:NitT/TauT family transport system substrate-binding protein
MVRLIVAISAALIWMALSAVPAAAADKVVLMLNWYVYGEHAPFYYGKAKGIYAAEGIDLEIQEGRGSAATTQAVAAKTADFGYVDVPTMMRAAVKGAPVVATGVLLQTSPMSAMGFVDKNIRKPEDIKGRYGRDHAGGFHDPDLAAVLEEDRLEGKRFPDGGGRRPDQTQRRHQRPG